MKAHEDFEMKSQFGFGASEAAKETMKVNVKKMRTFISKLNIGSWKHVIVRGVLK